jgi:hypothetical protein
MTTTLYSKPVMESIFSFIQGRRVLVIPWVGSRRFLQLKVLIGLVLDVSVEYKEI